MSTHPGPARLAFAALTVLLVGLALRAPIISVSPVLSHIQDHWNLSSVSASLLTTLPVLCFGALALAAPRLEQRFGLERTVLAMLLVAAAGVLARSAGGAAWLFTGTVVLGAATAVNNVLLPGLIKRDWSHAAGPLMSVYSVSMALGPTLAALLSVPLLGLLAGDLRLALAAWVASPVIAFVSLRLLQRPAGRRAATAARPRGAVSSGGSLLRDSLAWQVSLYLGIQSLIFYAISAWLPTLLADRGLSALAAGSGFSLFNLVSIAGSFSAPLLAVRMKQQSLLALAGGLLWLSGLSGLLLVPAVPVQLWVALCGLGSGLSFSLALTLLVLRSRTPSEAARLSGMAQAGGYLLAALGPVLIGWLYGQTGAWDLPVTVLLDLVPLLILTGMAAGRARFVLDGTDVTATSR